MSAVIARRGEGGGSSYIVGSGSEGDENASQKACDPRAAQQWWGVRRVAGMVHGNC